MLNLFDALSPLYYGTKILGLSPYHRAKNGYVKSKIGNLYILFAIVFLIVSMGVVMVNMKIVSDVFIIFVSIKKSLFFHLPLS